jgi:hypothetical protein
LKNISFSLGLFGILLALLLVSSCKNEEELGLEVQPPEDKIIVGFNNNSGIVAYTVREDSVRSDEVLTNLIGSINDPIFGSATAGVYVQFRIPDNNISFGTSPVADSIVLQLAYSGGYYGDITTRQSLKVYEVSEDFYLDSSYYSNRSFNHYSTCLSNFSFIPKPSDSVAFGGKTYAPHMRITLDNSLAQKFINASGTADLSDNAYFVNFFKGLYIVSDRSWAGGAIVYMNLLSSLSKITLYYHNADEDSLTYTFPINENSARVGSFNHYAYSGANHDFQAQIAGDTSRGQNILYLQSMAGVKTYIKFVNLRSLLYDGNVVINKAELVITPNVNLQGDYVDPPQLALAMINEDGTISFLPDQYYGTSYFGGVYTSSTGEYRFNLATYVQYLMKYEDYTGKGLYLTIAGSSTNGGRLVFNGPETTSSNLRLEISYTKL